MVVGTSRRRARRERSELSFVRCGCWPFGCLGFANTRVSRTVHLRCTLRLLALCGCGGGMQGGVSGRVDGRGGSKQQGPSTSLALLTARRNRQPAPGGRFFLPTRPRGHSWHPTRCCHCRGCPWRMHLPNQRAKRPRRGNKNNRGEGRRKGGRCTRFDLPKNHLATSFPPPKPNPTHNKQRCSAARCTASWPRRWRCARWQA